MPPASGIAIGIGLVDQLFAYHLPKSTMPIAIPIQIPEATALWQD
jgi:hypothetical protein